MMKSVMPCAAYIFMMCQMIGRPPISTIGFGFVSVSSAMRVPRPPARMTALVPRRLSIMVRSRRLGLHSYVANMGSGEGGQFLRGEGEQCRQQLHHQPPPERLAQQPEGEGEGGGIIRLDEPR